MKKNSISALFVLLIIILAACVAQPTLPASTPQTSPVSTNTSLAAAPTQAIYTGPFAYCAAVGAIDKPDARYVGQPLPDVLMQGYLKASGASPDAANDPNFRKMTIWRCMGGKVYVCNFGANLPCDSKANTNKTPTQALIDFCKQNPDTPFIPMAVTGHDTIYSWHCVKDVPALLAQISQVDAAGFLANIWYPVEPAP